MYYESIIVSLYIDCIEEFYENINIIFVEMETWLCLDTHYLNVTISF